MGGAKDNSPRLLAIGERTVCLAAADDWLNEHETDESAHKSRRWLDQPPTEKQLAYLLPEHRQDLSLTRYEASALLTFRFNRGQIRRLIFDAVDAATGWQFDMHHLPPPAAVWVVRPDLSRERSASRREPATLLFAPLPEPVLPPRREVRRG